MEIIQENGKISYTLKEKFLLVGPEQRINRSMFFKRSLILNIGTGILLFVSGNARFLFPDELWGNEFFLVFLLLMVNAILFYFQSTLIVKRFNDFEESGIQYAALYKTLLVLSTIIGIINISGMPEISENLSLDIIYSNIELLLWILCVYPLFRPGIQGNNQYGPDDSNVKVGFLG